MAAHERVTTKASISSQTLLQKLAIVLPKDKNFKIYHLSTPPIRTSSLYSAPSNARPDRTYCESHFLAASIRTRSTKNEQSKDVLVFAIEVLVYSTSYDTTFFVSKADSTGYLHLLGLPKGTPSPLRDISVTFLQHLLDQHQRPNIRSVISLFARAQDQYLFPGSVEYNGKHVLDDRGLVRWWCRVLDPLIEGPNSSPRSGTSEWGSIKGYLIVPGLDTHETLSYVPRTPGSTNSSWIMGHPLQKISRYSNDVPPRCLIPHYPDDPKARFLDDLDEEIIKGRNSSSGQWKSVKSVDQFWDMMAFRQECSAGRLVGFIWIVFEPTSQHQSTESVMRDSQSTIMTTDSQQCDKEYSSTSKHNYPNPSISPTTSFNASSQPPPISSSIKADDEDLPTSQQTAASSRSQSPVKKKKLSGPIISRQPRVKTQQKSYLPERPESTAYYLWRPEGRGQVTVEQSDYKRVTELLLRLDFANLELATSSSQRWISEVQSGAWGSAGEAWGQALTGTKLIETRTYVNTAGVNSLNLGLVRKKRKASAVDENVREAPSLLSTDEAAPQINILGTGMIRKKAKV